MIKYFKKKNNYTRNKKKIFDLIKRKYGEYYIFITANSIGEVFTICALMHEFKKIYTGKTLIFCPKKHIEIPKVFFPKAFDLIKSLPFNILVDIANTAEQNVNLQQRIQKGIPVSLRLRPDDPIFFKLHELKYSHVNAQGLSFENLIKFMLEIPWNSKLKKEFKIKKHIANQVLSRFNLKYKKYSLFLPGNNTRAPVSAKTFLKIAKNNEKDNIKSIINIAGSCFLPNIELLKKHQIISASIFEVVHLAANAESVIGGANGMMSFLAWYLNNRKIKVVVLHSKKTCYDYRVSPSGKVVGKFKKMKTVLSFRQGCPELVESNKYFSEYLCTNKDILI